MTLTLKERWVAALRSGEYEQGYGALVTPRPGGKQYCCLGVLCQVAGVAATGHTLLHDFDQGTELMQEIGMSFEFEQTLSHMNDGQQRSFDEIANYIEENL